MKEIFTSLRRTPYQTFTAFSVLFFTLFLALILFISLSFLNGILGYLETRPQVTVYFQTKTPENQIFKVRDELVNSGKVLSIKYISQKEAFKIYQDLNKDNPLLLEMVSADILPPSLEVYAKKPNFLPEIAEYLKKQANIDEVQFQKDIFDRLLTLTGIVRKGSFIFFVYLIIMSIIVLTTTTMFKITLKKDEIELLKLLGATNFYIQKPYLLEGVFLGFVASAFSFLILLLMILYFNPFLSSYLKGVPNLTFNLNFYQLTVWPLNPLFLSVVFLLAFIFGSTISIISSLIATQKHLKV
jgi:cell division transport system permease protein